jgi:hypothetical protein
MLHSFFSIEKLKSNCENEWESHWQCLDKKNHLLYKCRDEEKRFNQCVFDKLVSLLLHSLFRELKKYCQMLPKEPFPFLKRNVRSFE